MPSSSPCRRSRNSWRSSAPACDAWIYPMVFTAAHTGARRSELIRMRVADVDFASGTLLVREKKRSKGRRTTRRVPLSAELAAVLKEWLAAHPGGPQLFCHAGEVGRSKKRSRTTGHQSGPGRARTEARPGGTVRGAATGPSRRRSRRARCTTTTSGRSPARRGRSCGAGTSCGTRSSRPASARAPTSGSSTSGSATPPRRWSPPLPPPLPVGAAGGDRVGLREGMTGRPRVARSRPGVGDLGTIPETLYRGFLGDVPPPDQGRLSGAGPCVVPEEFLAGDGPAHVPAPPRGLLDRVDAVLAAPLPDGELRPSRRSSPPRRGVVLLHSALLDQAGRAPRSTSRPPWPGRPSPPRG